MTPSFLEHWAQRAFNAFEGGSDFNAFDGMVIMAINWLGSTTTAHQFFKTIPYPSPLIYFSCELIRYMLLHRITPQISSTVLHATPMSLQRV